MLGVAGSARRGGNSDRLLEEALAGAAESARVEHLLASELKVEPCRACDACRTLGHCIIGSDAAVVHEKLSAADALILSTPVYFGGVPARLKALIDRAQAQHWSWLKRGSPPPSKPALLLVAAGRPHMKNSLASVRTTAAAWLAVLGFWVWEVRGYSGLDEASAAAARPEILAEARTLGRQLAVAEAKGRRSR